MEIERGEAVIEFEDNLDAGYEMRVYLEDYAWLRINRDNAKSIINHLTKVFNITPEELMWSEEK